jgi:hypothetical protein
MERITGSFFFELHVWNEIVQYRNTVTFGSICHFHLNLSLAKFLFESALVSLRIRHKTRIEIPGTSAFAKKNWNLKMIKNYELVRIGILICILQGSA